MACPNCQTKDRVGSWIGLGMIVAAVMLGWVMKSNAESLDQGIYHAQEHEGP